MLRNWSIICTLALMGTCAVLASFADGADGNPVAHVKVFKVERSSDIGKISGMGSISCPKSLELGFDETGCIAEMLVDEGERVRAGQLLARLDDSVLVAEKAAIEARLVVAETEVKYNKNEVRKKQLLVDKDAVSDTDFRKALFELEKAEASVLVAKAEIRTIETKIRKKTLVAPIAGIVAQRHVDVGASIMPGSNKVMRVIQCEEVFAEIDLGERLYPILSRAVGAQIQVDAFPGKIFHGQIDRVGPEVDKKNRTFKVRIIAPNPDLALRPGMFAQAQISVRIENAPILVPVGSLLDTPLKSGPNTVFVIKDGLSLKRSVTIGEIKDSSVEIVKGLEQGDIVAIDGIDGLADLSEVVVDSIKESGT